MNSQFSKLLCQKLETGKHEDLGNFDKGPNCDGYMAGLKHLQKMAGLVGFFLVCAYQKLVSAYQKQGQPVNQQQRTQDWSVKAHLVQYHIRATIAQIVKKKNNNEKWMIQRYQNTCNLLCMHESAHAEAWLLQKMSTISMWATMDKWMKVIWFD